MRVTSGKATVKSKLRIMKGQQECLRARQPPFPGALTTRLWSSPAMSHDTDAWEENFREGDRESPGEDKRGEEEVMGEPSRG